MAIDLGDEIMQDFLVEAGEILEKLGEQLVELEHSPGDYDLLNAIFRGFHTVKGGAGFLNIGPLVEVCHKAEDVFNLLRQGSIRVDPLLMDVILEVLDVVNSMFRYIRNGKPPEAAEPELLARLASFTQPAPAVAPKPSPPLMPAPVASAPKPSPEPKPAPATPKPVRQEPTVILPPACNAVEEALFAMLDPDGNLQFNDIQDSDSRASEPETPQPAPANAPSDEITEEQPAPANAPSDEITEEEFEALLDQLHGKTGEPEMAAAPVQAPLPPATAPAPDEITEDEFEALLDRIHGKGKHGGMPKSAAAEAAPAADEITEGEFEALLDQLHGKGKHGGMPAAVPPTVPALPAEPVDTPHEPARPAKPGAAPPTAETTVRVDTQRLDEIMNMVGELVLVRNRLQNLRVSLNDEEMAKAIANLDVVTSDLQVAVMKTRMQPIKKVFGRFPRVVRDLARNLDKEVQLELRGEETDLDKNLVEALADPLIHLVRNAVDHGIEMPAERQAAGKPREGRVILTASQEGHHIELSIEDDGKGIDPEVLRRKVVEKGLMDGESAARLDDRECFNLIFLPGLSTRSEISDISGRGVGMDVVKTRISQMNGTVGVDSVQGRGTRITIKLPLTLAIMPTLMVKLNQQPFALPLASVVEILDLDLTRTNIVDGQLVALVRSRALPLFYLKEWLIPGYYRDRREDAGSRHVVVVNVGGRHVGFVVDHLIGQEEVVIKPLGAKLQGVAGMAGATITGDGKIALILDVPGLMKRYAPVR